ncbi:energy-coupling factor ABC transporter ATP-binding protein [Anaerolentibacter hominis]|uniref:ABC transporter ATP-binding protein n=1 Tax=Anaerolentibacter hominis TaxID=3079009 RepID=UPI0031B8024F
MIEIRNVSFQYANADGEVLKELSLSIRSGECVLLCGESGCGKTTITRLINGLIPHYYEGELSGRTLVCGCDVSERELYETAGHVGSVFQNPRSQFFCVDTTSELAFGCENLGLSENAVRERIQEASEELNMTHLLGKNIFELSGGEKQKVACASVSAMRPEVLVLDEPTSNLDMSAIENLKETLRYWKSRGKTIVIAEHRLYWLKDICDRVIYLKDGRIGFDIPMTELCTYPREKICDLGLRTLSMKDLPLNDMDYRGTGELNLRNYYFSYGGNQVLDIPALSVPAGGVIALIGHNGAGKSTFSRCLCGLEKQFKGRTRLDGKDYGRRNMLKKCYMVMQDVNHQLFCESVKDEVLLGMQDEIKEKAEAVLAALDLDTVCERHPMSLSGGQKQRVAVASALLADKSILLFDEPTSGLDFHHMEQTAQLLRSISGGRTVFVVTHDPELIVRCCTHILQLENGRAAACYPLNEENRSRLFDFFAAGSLQQKYRDGAKKCLKAAEFSREIIYDTVH